MRIARLTTFALPVASALADERGDLAPSPGSAEGADRIGGKRDDPGRLAFDDPLQDRSRADSKLAAHIRRNGHLTALGHPCTHVRQFTSYLGWAQANQTHDHVLERAGAAVS